MIMIFGNPAFHDLGEILANIKEIEEVLIALEDEDSNKVMLGRRFSKAVYRLKLYTGKELEIFKQEEISEHCIFIISKIKDIFEETTWQIFQNEAGVLKVLSHKSLILDMLAKVKKIENLLQEVNYDLKWEKKQEKKAKKLAVRKLSFEQPNSFHYVPPERLLSVFGNDLHSIKSAREIGVGIEEVTTAFQGEDFISVFDFYTFSKLYEFYKMKGKLQEVMEDENNVVLEDLEEFFQRNPELGVSKNAELIKGYVSGRLSKPMGIRFSPKYGVSAGIREGVVHLARRDWESTSFLHKVDEPYLVINRTMDLFSMHSNPYFSEGLLLPPVKKKEIIGLVTPKHIRDSIVEFAKFAGLPVYGSDGILLWPTK